MFYSENERHRFFFVYLFPYFLFSFPLDSEKFIVYSSWLFFIFLVLIISINYINIIWFHVQLKISDKYVIITNFGTYELIGNLTSMLYFLGFYPLFLYIRRSFPPIFFPVCDFTLFSCPSYFNELSNCIVYQTIFVSYRVSNVRKTSLLKFWNQYN